jgi:hypothetical protein
LFKADDGKAEILGKPAELDSSHRDLGFVLEADGLYENISAGITWRSPAVCTK